MRRYGAGLQAVFAKKGNVQVVTGTKATAADAATYGCDVVFMCTGMHPSTAFLTDGDLAAAVDAKGFVKTTPTLQVAGFENVFSFGDCASPSQAGGARARGHPRHLYHPRHQNTRQHDRGGLASVYRCTNMDTRSGNESRAAAAMVYMYTEDY